MMDYFSKDFKSLIECLLEKNVARRPNIDKVMAHPFFKKIDFAKLEKKLVKPPFKPKIANLGKVSNAEKLWLKQELDQSPKNGEKNKTADSSLFKSFTYMKK